MIKFKNQDLTPKKAFEQFEKNLIRNSTVDFYQNLRIVHELHQLALFLGVFKENQVINIEDKVRYVQAVNFNFIDQFEKVYNERIKT